MTLYDIDKDYRMVYDEYMKLYLIQKKRRFFGWKTLELGYKDKHEADIKLAALRKEHRENQNKKYYKKRYVILED